MRLAGVPVIDDILAGTDNIMLDSMVIGLAIGQATSTRPVHGPTPRRWPPWSCSLSRRSCSSAATRHLLSRKSCNIATSAPPWTMSANLTAATNGGTVQKCWAVAMARRRIRSFTLEETAAYICRRAHVHWRREYAESDRQQRRTEVPTLYGLTARDQNYTVRLETMERRRLPSGSPARLEIRPAKRAPRTALPNRRGQERRRGQHHHAQFAAARPSQRDEPHACHWRRRSATAVAGAPECRSPCSRWNAWLRWRD